jgi:hypothetical protein
MQPVLLASQPGCLLAASLAASLQQREFSNQHAAHTCVNFFLSRVQLLSSSYDGTLKQWDMHEGTVEHTWHIGAPIESMVGQRY